MLAATALTHTGSASMLTVGSALLAAALTVVVWPLLHFAVTIAHEGGHALSTSMMGGKVSSIELNRPGPGGGTGIGGLGAFGLFVAGLAGYVAPSVFGVVGAVLLVEHLQTVVIWASVALLVLAVVQAKGLYTGALMIGMAVVFFVLGRYGSPGEQVFFAYTWVWFLLMGGFRHVIDLLAVRAKKKDTASDAHVLRTITHVPAAFWSGFFWLFSAVGLVYGGSIILGVVQIPVRW